MTGPSMPDFHAAESSTPVAPLATPQSGKDAPPWSVRDGGLAWHGDWMSAGHLAELLSGEDDGRVPESDVDDLLDLVNVGIAFRPASRHAASYRECQECGFEWFEDDPSTPENHRSTCSMHIPGGDRS